MIVAMDDQRLIGRDNGLPWRLPADLQRFKSITMGKPIVMGRLTWESLGRPLPGRRNIVITTRQDYTAEGADVVNSPEAAIALVAEVPEIMIIGGARLYEQMLPMAQRLYLTRVHGCFEGDTWFPEIRDEEWLEHSREDFSADEKNPHDWSLLELRRRV